MSASLVGSEMCIRDRGCATLGAPEVIANPCEPPKRAWESSGELQIAPPPPRPALLPVILHFD
eukprot:10149042-Alexandrium_andersonii.AAC.1